MYNYHLQDNELMHYGVLGMKWGRRKGASSNSKYKKYDSDIEKAKTNYKKLLKNDGSLNARKSAYADLKYAENLKKDTVILDKINSKPKSKRRLASEKKFKDMGLNDKEAAVEAYKKERTQKILLGVGAVAVTSLVAYSAYKKHDYKTDRILKSGTKIQNISTSDNKGVEAAFYASHKGADNRKYVGVFGSQLKGGFLNMENLDVYKTTTEAKSGIKIASHKTVNDTINEAIKNNPEFKIDLERSFKEQANSRGLKELKTGALTKPTLENINYNFVYHSPGIQKSNEHIFKILKEKGYDAVQDINDKKLSGYATKDPLVIFNGKEKLKVSSINQIPAKKINRAYKTQMLIMGGKKVAKVFGVGVAASTAAISGVNETKRQLNTKAAVKYKKEHPNSKLTVNEIVRNNNKEQS